MGTLSKYISLVLVAFLLGFSFLSIEQSSAQTPLPSYIQQPTYPTPSIPEFSVDLIGPPFVKNTTYVLNDKTGQIDAIIGYTNTYSSVKITIKNQPFTSFDSGFNGQVNLMYDVRIKSQTSDEWTNVYAADDSYPSQDPSSSSTELTINIENQRRLGSIAGSTIDIQVQAMLGTVHRVLYGQWAPWLLDGQVSGWSNTQTVSIPANIPLNSSQSLSPTPVAQSSGTSATTDSASDILLIAVVASLTVIIILLVVITYLLVYIRKKKIS